jgi:hypothetical protein
MPEIVNGLRRPKMWPGKVEMVSVAWIMQNTTDSVDGFGTWNDEDGRYSVDYGRMIRNKGCDSGFGYLINTILTEGFRVPIVLVKNYCTSNDPRDALVLGYGHHRMVAAILLGLDEIPVYWAANTKEYMWENESEGEEIQWDDSDWEDFEYWLESELE